MLEHMAMMQLSNNLRKALTWLPVRRRSVGEGKSKNNLRGTEKERSKEWDRIVGMWLSSRASGTETLKFYVPPRHQQDGL